MCPSKTYNPLEAQIECLDCPERTLTSKEGSISESDCKLCHDLCEDCDGQLTMIAFHVE